MMEKIENFVYDYLGTILISLMILSIIFISIVCYFNNQQLVKDYMIEFKISKEEAERRIRIDNNRSHKTTVIYNNSLKMPIVVEY